MNKEFTEQELQQIVSLNLTDAASLQEVNSAATYAAIICRAINGTPTPYKIVHNGVIIPSGTDFSGLGIVQDDLKIQVLPFLYREARHCVSKKGYSFASIDEQATNMAHEAYIKFDSFNRDGRNNSITTWLSHCCYSFNHYNNLYVTDTSYSWKIKAQILRAISSLELENKNITFDSILKRINQTSKRKISTLTLQKVMSTLVRVPDCSSKEENPENEADELYSNIIDTVDKDMPFTPDERLLFDTFVSDISLPDLAVYLLDLSKVTSNTQNNYSRYFCCEQYPGGINDLFEDDFFVQLFGQFSLKKIQNRRDVTKRKIRHIAGTFCLQSDFSPATINITKVFTALGKYLDDAIDNFPATVA